MTTPHGYWHIMQYLPGGGFRPPAFPGQGSTNMKKSKTKKLKAKPIRKVKTLRASSLFNK